MSDPSIHCRVFICSIFLQIHYRGRRCTPSLPRSVENAQETLFEFRSQRLHIGDYKRAYPTAKLIAPEEALSRHDDKSLTLDGGGFATFFCTSLNLTSKC